MRSGPVYHFCSMPLVIANRTNSTETIVMAEYSPNLPISVAKIYNFSWRGVGWAYSVSSKARILPMQDSSPTTSTTIFP